MKLSKFDTDAALDVLCEITPHVTAILSDECLMDTIGKSVKRDGMTKAGVMMLGIEKLTRLVPLILKNHRSEVYGIVAAMNRMDQETVAAQNILTTASQLREILQDKELLDFFKSCAPQDASG